MIFIDKERYKTMWSISFLVAPSSNRRDKGLRIGRRDMRKQQKQKDRSQNENGGNLY
jgi:hypothetical protein